jgi:hypothetical protein
MTNLPTTMIQLLAIFSPLFSKPTYQSFIFLFHAHILCKGRRTITEMLKRMGLRQIKNYSRYHDFFSKAKWSTFNGSKILLLKLFSLTPTAVTFSFDTTVERRKGPKIKGLGIQRDAVRSTKGRKVLVPGLNWLVCTIHIQLPWSKSKWALPILTILMPPENPLSTSKNAHDLKKTKKHKTLTQWTCQAVKLLRRWLGSNTKITVVADSAFATYALANTCIDLDITLVSRMRLDARTFQFPPPPKGRRGKKLVGERLPTFQDMLKDTSLVWTKVTTGWYGGKIKEIQILTGTCLWYGYGIRPVPISWVLTRDGEQEALIFSTNTNQSLNEMVGVFVDRWAIEVTFEEARRHLGMETQRQWSDKSVDRMTPCILASYSIINLIAVESLRSKDEKIPIQTSSWYKKSHVTFSDVLAYVRMEIFKKNYFPQFDENTELWRNELEEIIHQMAAA